MSALVKVEYKSSTIGFTPDSGVNAKIVKFGTDKPILNTSYSQSFHAIECETNRKVSFVGYQRTWSDNRVSGLVWKYFIFYTDTLEEIERDSFGSYVNKVFMVDLDQKLLRGKV